MMHEDNRIPVSELIEKGKIYIGDGYRAKNSELSDHGYPFARAGNLNNGFLFNDADFIPFDEIKKVGNKKSKIGDVAFTSKGTIGRFGFVKSTTQEFVYSPQLCFWRSLDYSIIHPVYLYYWMNSYLFSSQVAMVSGQTDMALYVNLTDQRKMFIDLPTLQTQKKIASVLSAYDDLIENNNQRIQLLEDMAQEIYKEWFVRFRFPDYQNTVFADKNGVPVPHGTKGAVPEGWEKKPIDEFESFSISTSKLRKFQGEKRYLATADVSGIFITGEGELINWDNKPSRAQLKPELNSVFFARMSNTFKVLNFTESNQELVDQLALSSGFLGLKAKDKSCFPYLFTLVKSDLFHAYKDVYANGSTQVSLTNEGFHMIRLNEPKLEFIQKFGEMVYPMYDEINILMKKNQVLQDTRDLLLPRLISGKLSLDNIPLPDNQLQMAAEPSENYK